MEVPFAEKLNIPLAIIDKRRPRPNVSEITNIIGDVAGKKVVKKPKTWLFSHKKGNPYSKGFPFLHNAT